MCCVSSTTCILISGIGVLSVLIRENNRDTEIWRRSGNQGQNWQKAIIDIGRVDGAFQVCCPMEHQLLMSGLM